jgi:F0F1-type ATP synthase membrane subunit c/vacuolar-type H+-ATPase subunit K
MALIGYWRTSTTEQDAERQIQSLMEIVLVFPSALPLFVLATPG